MSDSGEIPKCGAVLVAAGKGERMGGELPKQFAIVGGEPLVAHALRVINGLDFISELVLVVPQAGLPTEVGEYLNVHFQNVQIVVGGARRQDSVAAGLAALRHDFQVALVHDGARPFPEARAIATLARAVRRDGGGLLAQRVVDTVKRADAAGNVAATLEREGLWLAQTPQAIGRELVPRAIAEMRRTECTITDEAMLLESWGVAVRLVESGAENFKVTLPGDFARAEAVLAARSGQA